MVEQFSPLILGICSKKNMELEKKNSSFLDLFKVIVYFSPWEITIMF